MSVSKQNGGCNKCKRISELNNPPSARVDLRTSPMTIRIVELMLATTQGFNGDMAEHCQQSVEQALSQYIANIINEVNTPSGICVEVTFPRLKITAKCICNQDDIEAGLGPPSSTITIEQSDGSVNQIPCPPDGGGGPPNTA